MLPVVRVADLPSCNGLTNAQHERCRPSSPLAVSLSTPSGCNDRASRRYSCHQSCSFALKPVDASMSRRPSASVWLVSAALSTGFGSAGATCSCCLIRKPCQHPCVCCKQLSSQRLQDSCRGGYVAVLGQVCITDAAECALIASSSGHAPSTCDQADIVQLQTGTQTLREWLAGWAMAGNSW